MSKRAIYNDEAQRLYVNQGMTLDAIESIFEGKVTRRTLFNWKEEGRWDDKRVRYVDETADLDDMIRAVARVATERAMADPNPKNVLAMARAISALKSTQGLSLLDEPDQPDGAGMTPQEKREGIVDAVRQALRGQL